MKKRIESEKNNHLADIAFVLRKHQDFLKVQEEVTKAQHNYNRILGYSKEEGDIAEAGWVMDKPHASMFIWAKIPEKARHLGSLEFSKQLLREAQVTEYRDWETDRKSTRLNSSHRSLSRMPSSA